ncbi:hypothetical protein [Xanthobacter aminoxidans]|uniref:hypothetical protein n=1 Tax=Xanthobacter aminoxidans TaxID=186280 RepID=UPI002022E7C5|nr:hypothetical protein [Xanthobacter aminoxidans]MCL8382121.1 hypothetical protein [Xanthobacter aminoxidans]
MGEIAEMMLDGTLCASCGGYIEDGEPDGMPRYCSARCRRDSGIDGPARGNLSNNCATCPICSKQFTSRKARRQHQRDKHERPVAPEGSAHEQ